MASFLLDDMMECLQENTCYGSMPGKESGKCKAAINPKQDFAFRKCVVLNL